MTMFKRLTMLLCVSLFFLSQSVIASDDKAMSDMKAEPAKEMAKEATAAGDKMEMKEGEMKEGEMKEGEMKKEGEMMKEEKMK